MQGVYDLAIHKGGEPLVMLTGGSPQRVTCQDLENNELLLHALVRVSRSVSMREASFNECLQQLDSKHCGRLSAGNLAWHRCESIKLRMIFDYCMRSIKRPGFSRFLIINRLKALYISVGGIIHDPDAHSQLEVSPLADRQQSTDVLENSHVADTIVHVDETPQQSTDVLENSPVADTIGVDETPHEDTQQAEETQQEDTLLATDLVEEIRSDVEMEEIRSDVEREEPPSPEATQMEIPATQMEEPPSPEAGTCTCGASSTCGTSLLEAMETLIDLASSEDELQLQPGAEELLAALPDFPESETEAEAPIVPVPEVLRESEQKPVLSIRGFVVVPPPLTHVHTDMVVDHQQHKKARVEARKAARGQTKEKKKPATEKKVKSAKAKAKAKGTKARDEAQSSSSAKGEKKPSSPATPPPSSSSANPLSTEKKPRARPSQFDQQLQKYQRLSAESPTPAISSATTQIIGTAYASETTIISAPLADHRNRNADDVVALAKKIAPELDIDAADMNAAPVVRESCQREATLFQLFDGKKALTQVTVRMFGGRDFAILAIYALQLCVASGMQRENLRAAKLLIVNEYKAAN